MAMSATVSRALGRAAMVAAPLALSAFRPSRLPATHLYEHPARITLAAPVTSAHAGAPPQAPSDKAIAHAIERELSLDGIPSGRSIVGGQTYQGMPRVPRQGDRPGAR